MAVSKENGQPSNGLKVNGADGPDGKDLKVVGKPFRKVDARSKCVGETRFADDIVLPRMLYCKILRSPEPHAIIKSIDISKALALPGVYAVLTGKDTPIPYGILPVSQDEYPLCVERVRFIGDPVAAVAAVDEDTAFDAMNLIEVEYERLQSITSIEEAVMIDEPRIQEYGDGGNVHKKVHLEFGDLDAGFAEADLVREDIFFYEGNTHLPMEQHAALAHYDSDDKLTLWSSTQTPHYVHRALAKTSRDARRAHPRHRHAERRRLWRQERPFQPRDRRRQALDDDAPPRQGHLDARRGLLLSSRSSSRFDAEQNRRQARRLRFTALDFESYLDGGAYGSYGVASTFYTGALQTVTYEVPRYRFRGLRAFTNKPPCGPKRGHGTPQPRFGLEIQLDKIAEQLDLDPAEMRLKHLARPNSVTANYLRIGSIGLGPCIEKVVAGSDWKNKYKKLPYGKGVGIACSSYICGAGLPIYWNNMPHSGVQLRLDRQGGVCVQCGSTDIGQGSDSVLAYVVAEILGIDPFDIRVVTADTDLTPVDLGSYSSRVTLMTGNAAIQAAERARELLTLAVAEKLGVPVENLSFADRRVFDVENPETGVTFAEAVVLAESKYGTIGTVGSYTPPRSPGKFKGAGVGPSPAYSYSAAIAEVDVDADTGLVTVERIYVGHDIGKSINPMLVMGQVEGSIYMGLGEALMEEMVYRANRNVVHKFPSLLEYKSPTTLEMCDVVTYLIEDPDPNGPFGAKEVGQGPLASRHARHRQRRLRCRRRPR